MSKTRHENVVYGTITVAVPFTDLADIAKAEATIRGLTLPGVRVVTRLGKMPVTPGTIVTAPGGVAVGVVADMPAIPAALKR